MNKVEFLAKLSALPYVSTDPVHSHKMQHLVSSDKVHILEVSVPIGPTTIGVDVPSTMKYLMLYNMSPSNDMGYMIYYYVGDTDGNHREMWLTNYGFALLPNVTPHTAGQILFEAFGEVSKVQILIVE